MVYCFDLDGTLCTNTEGFYGDAKPLVDRIKKVNELYNNGHIIKIDSARGSTTGKDWLELTTNQLNTWGVSYHEVRTGEKMEADMFIDDKGVNDKSFFGDETIGDLFDDKIRSYISGILGVNKFPDYDNVYTDTFSELIDKLCIVHIRYWYLEDSMASAKNDEELVLLRKKSESLFKEKRPMLVTGLDKLIYKIIKGDINYTQINTKHYKGWDQKEK